MKILVRHIAVFVFVILATVSSRAQVSWPTPEVENLYREARNYHSNGNLREAIIRYQQAIQIAPEIVLLYRELAHAYYLAQGYDDVINTLDPIIKQGVADAETYKIMVQSLLAIDEKKRAKKLIRDAIIKLPNAGPLYHQMGLMYEDDNEYVYALESWLDGIEKDPTYHINYYEAARAYMETDKVVWAILYGEIFVNIEQKTKRSYDTRALLIEAYRRIFTSLATGEIPKFGAGVGQTKNSFEEAVYNTFIRLSPVMSDGFTTENLIMLRTRFIMDWTLNHAAQYPFTLFARHDDLIRNGFFDMYNQWLFGKVENPQQYEAWKKFHPNAMPQFESWLSRNRLLPQTSDSYNTKQVDGIFQKRKD